MEVIYTGLHRTPSQIVEAARDEDVDVIGLSVLSGAHERLFSAVIEQLKSEEMSDVLVVGGGIIPDGDVPRLLELGVAAVFTPGAPLSEIISFIQEHAPARWS
jgi:methylmalonyl-CoA mutase C-terminal domain/subunit